MCVERVSAVAIGGGAGDPDILIMSYTDVNDVIRFYCGVSMRFMYMHQNISLTPYMVVEFQQFIITE